MFEDGSSEGSNSIQSFWTNWTNLTSSSSSSSSSSSFSIVVLLNTFTVMIVTLMIKYKINQMSKKALQDPVYGFPSAPGAHWLVGHTHIIRNGNSNSGNNRNGRNSNNGDSDSDNNTGSSNSSGSSSNSGSGELFLHGYQKVYVDSAHPISGVASLWFFHIPSISVLQGKDVKKILLSSSYRKPNKLLDAHIFNMLGKRNLISLTGKDWRNYRSAVHKSLFTQAVVKQSQHAMHVVGNTMATSLLREISAAAAKSSAKSSQSSQNKNNDEAKRDSANANANASDSDSASASSSEGDDYIIRLILPLMKMCTMDAFGVAVLDGYEFQCSKTLTLMPIAASFDYLISEFSRRFKRPWDPTTFLYNIVPTKSNIEYRKHQKYIRKFVEEQISNARKRIVLDEEEEEKEEIQQQQQQQQQVDFEQQKDHGINQQNGNVNTKNSNNTKNHSNKNHPHKHKQELLTNLIKAAAAATNNYNNNGDGDGNDHSYAADTNSNNSTTDNTNKLAEETLGDVMMTLLFGAYETAITRRNITKPITLPSNGMTLQTGQLVNISIWNVQRSKFNYPYRPNDIIPERWSRQRQRNLNMPPANRDAFCTFAAGARNCIGRVFAMQEIVILLACLLKRLKFELLHDNYQILPKISALTQQPDDKLPMKISVR
ncbi:cytochrome P450 [Fragilariopsis cylindrus CCMP1102]|uniref:Cytochrome P450 n=1 Tax=Fragilariopsis cylindrus CCMP1102 TaxID=635003 RepID=A0A1E7EYQ6_9STRA|nr:cytochrome P450 [Fragilariopsis cylindrus CCMP1102]|eukprot:OEU11052.1 cytochrome P450 [Fragilariopsis cylindrus CCMP1102]